MLPKVNISLHAKYPLFLSNFNETWILSTNFRKIPQYQISQKPVQLQISCFLITDGRRDGQDGANSRLFATLQTRLKTRQGHNLATIQPSSCIFISAKSILTLYPYFLPRFSTYLLHSWNFPMRLFLTYPRFMLDLSQTPLFLLFNNAWWDESNVIFLHSAFWVLSSLS